METSNNHTNMANKEIYFMWRRIIYLGVITSGILTFDFYNSNYLSYATNKVLKNQGMIIYKSYSATQNDITRLIKKNIDNAEQKSIISSELTQKKNDNSYRLYLKNNLLSKLNINQSIKEVSHTKFQAEKLSCNCNCKQVKINYHVNCKLLHLKEKEYKSPAINDVYFLSSEIESKRRLEPQLDLIKYEEKTQGIDIKFQKTKHISQINSPNEVGDRLTQVDKLRNSLLIDPIIIKRLITERNLRIAPASSSGTPSGYGATWGQGYIGGGIFLPFDDGRTDGSFSLGFGLGNAVKSVGVEVNVNVTSLGGGNNFDFADSGTIGFKVHKYFNPDIAVAFGWVDPISWGDSNSTKDTFYGVVTKSFKLKPENAKNNLPLTVSLGVGSGIFRSIGAINSGENSVNLFASLGLRLTPQFALSSSWTGNRLNLGASLVPLKKTPLVINAVITDVTDNLENGTGLSLSAGYAFQF